MCSNLPEHDIELPVSERHFLDIALARPQAQKSAGLYFE